ncbi:hypothetical protein F5Y16DRAFT_382070 [Xylariaceae sp. FL0255]|nr:hypothetical protein F5Y16DRAFT_382070 [Xylariaceae sp. FL0255]
MTETNQVLMLAGTCEPVQLNCGRNLAIMTSWCLEKQRLTKHNLPLPRSYPYPGHQQSPPLATTVVQYFVLPSRNLNFNIVWSRRTLRPPTASFPLLLGAENPVSPGSVHWTATTARTDVVQLQFSNLTWRYLLHKSYRQAVLGHTSCHVDHVHAGIVLLVARADQLSTIFRSSSNPRLINKTATEASKNILLFSYWLLICPLRF